MPGLASAFGSRLVQDVGFTIFDLGPRSFWNPRYTLLGAGCNVVHNHNILHDDLDQWNDSAEHWSLSWSFRDTSAPFLGNIVHFYLLVAAYFCDTLFCGAGVR